MKGLDERTNAHRDRSAAIKQLARHKRAFDRKVRRLTAKRGLTQSQLAERLEIKQPTVAAILSGHHKPPPKSAKTGHPSFRKK